MLLNPFQAIKQQLATVPAIKLITWFNNQVKAGTLHTEPAILIEFPEELNPETLNRQSQQAELVTRVHVVHKLHTDKDGSIKENIMQQHEDAATAIFDKLHEFAKEGPEGMEFNSNDRTAYRLDMDKPGFAVTMQDFECLLYQPVVSSPYQTLAKPEPKIIADNSRPEFINVTSPILNETWTIGETYLIKWDQFLLSGDVKIDLILGSGGVVPITGHASGGSHDWPIPENVIPAEDYMIRVTSNDNTDIVGQSSRFEIIEPAPVEFITVISPNGGELWMIGDERMIRWEKNFEGDVKIILLRDSQAFLTISDHAPDTAFNWLLPDELAPDRTYKIRIESIGNPEVFDESDNDFEIAQPKK